MAQGILVFAEVRDGQFKAINRELVGAAQLLAGSGGGDVSIAVIGDGVDAAVEEARGLGAQRVYTVTGPAFAQYSTQVWTTALDAVLEASGAKIVLFGATAMGRDLSARLAARRGAALFTDCTEVSLVDGNLSVRRPVYSGKVYEERVAKSDVQMASIRANVYAPVQGGEATSEVQAVDVTIDESSVGGRVTKFEASGGTAVDLTEAEIIVSGGRALKSAENFGILQELADVLGGAVGASRAAVDAGYAPHSIQVGQTGKVVNPKLYMAFGISGAIQHLVGMRTSKVIVAVNKDENAPIFQVADYGIVGDLFEIVPLLTKEFRELLGKN